MNVLDLRGPEFLAFYLTLLPLAIVAALLLRWSLRRPGGAPAIGSPSLPELHPFEVAYLAGGPRAATDAVIATLVQRGSLEVDPKTRQLRASSLPPAGVTPLEETVYDAVVQDGHVAKVRKSAKDMARAAAARLETVGLVLGRAQGVRARLFPALLMLVVLTLGVAKLIVGSSRDKPIAFLFPLSLATLIITLVFLVREPIRTRRGSRVLKALWRRHIPLRTTAARAPQTLATEDASLAFALYGSTIFMFGPLSDLRQAMAPPTSGGTGCGSSSGCGSGSSDGGGGCGGGGCGGCGGGGD